MDRETRREKVIEAKNREIRLKMKSVRVEVDIDSHDGSSNMKNTSYKPNRDDQLIIQCEQEYEAALETVKNYLIIFKN